MRVNSKIVGGMAVLLAGALTLPAIAQEKKAEEKKAEEKKAEPAKAKAEKVSGDVGLLDTEKNYMIVVNKEGKLIQWNFKAKTKANQIRESKATKEKFAMEEGRIKILLLQNRLGPVGGSRALRRAFSAACFLSRSLPGTLHTNG